jgi:hypothetical protein
MPYAQCISASLRGETTFVSPYAALALILEPNNSYGQKNGLLKFFMNAIIVLDSLPISKKIFESAAHWSPFFHFQSEDVIFIM